MTYFPAFKFKNGRTLVIDNEGESLDFCEQISVKRIFVNSETGEEELEIEVIKGNGTASYPRCKRSDLSGRAIDFLSTFGLHVAKIQQYESTVEEILYETEKQATVVNYHEKLGFKEVGNDLVFFGADAVSDTIQSRFAEFQKLEPSGDFDSWRAGIIPFLKNNQNLLLALAIGASAPVASLLERKGSLEDTLIFLTVGSSSTGKTTALNLSASAWGKPGTKGVINVLIDTENRLFANLGSRNGFPTFIDEASARPEWDFTKILYNIALSVEKGRCNPDGSPRPQNTWSGTVMMTGERSLLAQSNGNGGINARLIEIDIPWTKGSEEADAIKAFYTRHHGTAYVPYMKTLMNRETCLVADYLKCVAFLSSKVTTKSGIEDRILKKLAIIFLTADIMSDAWNIEVDMKALVDILINIFEQNKPNADKPTALWEAVCNYVFSNQKLFPHEHELENLSSCNKQGVISNYKGKACVWILEDVFIKFLTEYGLLPNKRSLKPLIDSGKIAYFGDRFKKSFTAQGVEISAYCVFLPTTPLHKKTPPIKSKICSQREKLLGD